MLLFFFYLTNLLVISRFTLWKKIIATGSSDTSFRTQQPDSTVFEPRFREKPTFSFATPCVLSTTTCLPKDKGDSSMKALPFRGSSVISVDYNSTLFEDSDCMINGVPAQSTSWKPSTLASPIFSGDEGKVFTRGQSNCDSLQITPSPKI